MANSRHPEQLAQTYERDRRAALMKREGLSWDEVAAASRTWDLPSSRFPEPIDLKAAPPYPSRSSAFLAVKKRMVQARDLSLGEVDLYRQETIDRYEAVIQAAWPFMQAGSEKHMAIVLRAARQIAELRGEMAPVTIQIGEADVDRALRELSDELNRRAAAPEGQARTGASAPPADS